MYARVWSSNGFRDTFYRLNHVFSGCPRSANSFDRIERKGRERCSYSKHLSRATTSRRTVRLSQRRDFDFSRVLIARAVKVRQVRPPSVKLRASQFEREMYHHGVIYMYISRIGNVDRITCTCIPRYVEYRSRSVRGSTSGICSCTATFS